MDPELSELLHKLKRAKNGRKKRAPTVAGAVGEMDSTSSVGKSVAEESDFLKAKARVERDRMRTIFPTIFGAFSGGPSKIGFRQFFGPFSVVSCFTQCGCGFGCNPTSCQET